MQYAQRSYRTAGIPLPTNCFHQAVNRFAYQQVAEDFFIASSLAVSKDKVPLNVATAYDRWIDKQQHPSSHAAPSSNVGFKHPWNQRKSVPPEIADDFSRSGSP